MVPMLIGIVVIVFGLMHVIPGDPARVLLGDDATAEAVENLRRSLGLDRSLPVQLFDYFARLLTGDLGRSMFQSVSVAALIAQRLPATIELATAAIVISAALGIALGAVAAVRHRGVVDLGAMAFAQIGVSMPVFWLGILLMYVFAVELRWLPSVGRGESLFTGVVALARGDFATLPRSLSHIALPALALGLTNAAIVSRLVRAAMLEVLTADYVRTARAKGVIEHRVVIRHALRNALVPVISIVGWQVGVLLGGSVLTETIFGWPGLGQLAVNAISQRDIPLVQGIVLSFAVLFALINLVVDVLYCVVDPRIRVEG